MESFSSTLAPRTDTSSSESSTEQIVSLPYHFCPESKDTVFLLPNHIYAVYRMGNTEWTL